MGVEWGNPFDSKWIECERLVYCVGKLDGMFVYVGLDLILASGESTAIFVCTSLC